MNALYRFLRGTWRLAQPLRYTRGAKWLQLPGAYCSFLWQWYQFRSQGGIAPYEQVQPAFFDGNSQSQSGGSQYFFQDVWALCRLAEVRPKEHHDVGSRLDGFVAQATSICPVTYWDIRPPGFILPKFAFRMGSLLSLPLDDQSVNSLSCLHTAEHIGLGRYGDPIAPDGCSRALFELARVLAGEGQLLFSMPIGRERVCFNAHRIWHPERPLQIMGDLRLLEFSGITDDGEFAENVNPQDFRNSVNACGLYRLTR